LIAALHNGRGKAAAHLAKRGARMDLEAAAGVGRLDVVKTFVNEDGSLKANATKARMESGFMWACEYGRTSVVDFLLAKGLDPGAQPHGETGLHWAAYVGHAGIVKSLLKWKAPEDSCQSESRGRGPLVLFAASACPTDKNPGVTRRSDFQFC